MRLCGRKVSSRFCVVLLVKLVLYATFFTKLSRISTDQPQCRPWDHFTLFWSSLCVLMLYFCRIVPKQSTQNATCFPMLLHAESVSSVQALDPEQGASLHGEFACEVLKPQPCKSGCIGQWKVGGLTNYNSRSRTCRNRSTGRCRVGGVQGTSGMGSSLPRQRKSCSGEKPRCFLHLTPRM